MTGVPFSGSTADPSDLGFDTVRLGRIDTHFSRYVDDGRLPGFAVLVGRGAEVAYFATYGWRDREGARPVEPDTLFRIYSMTKPVTSIAAMMLYEDGLFDLADPVSRFVPEFGDLRVFAGGSAVQPLTKPASEPMLVWHLLTHTAGLTYGFYYRHPVDAMYRSAGFEWGAPKGADLGKCCEIWAGLPLLFEPGTSWNYSVATDVLARIVEVVSGQRLDEFFADRILGPLEMRDTAFHVPPEERDRLAVLYMPDAVTQKAVPISRQGRVPDEQSRTVFGGTGLVSTVGDYHRFTRMLLGGGSLGDTRIIGTRTLEYMTRNHLPGGEDMAHFGTPVTAEAEEGVGFGLGFSVVLDAAAGKVLSNEGEFAWGGAASTAFFVDPAEELIAVFMTQLLPSGTWPIRRELRQLVYQSLIG